MSVDQMLENLQVNDKIEWNDDIYYIVCAELDDEDDLRVVHEDYYEPQSEDDYYEGTDYTYMNVYKADWHIVEKASGIEKKEDDYYVFK